MTKDALTLSGGHVSGPKAPDAIFGDEDDVSLLQHVGHDGLHGRVAGRREGQGQRVPCLKGVLDPRLGVVHDL